MLEILSMKAINFYLNADFNERKTFYALDFAQEFHLKQLIDVRMFALKVHPGTFLCSHDFGT